MVNALFMNTQFALSRMPHYFRLKSLKVIRPKVEINFENQYYQVKTLNCVDELAEVMKLRFDVFFKEFSQLPSLFSFFSYDIDMHDFLCDHLIVKDKENGKIVACYRLLLSGVSSKFYSEGEFELNDFLKTPGVKLELGRACVHKDYRSGVVISSLWKGLIEYARRSEAQYLFGCSSIPKKDFESLPFIMEDLQNRDALVTDFAIGIRPKYQPSASLNLSYSTENLERPKNRPMNSLMNMYLLAGAKFSRQGAYDAEMECLDLMTILDISKLPASFERKFG